MIERTFNVKIPAGTPKGDHRILFCDADTMNRIPHAAASSESLHGYPGNGVAAQPGARQ